MSAAPSTLSGQATAGEGVRTSKGTSLMRVLRGCEVGVAAGWVAGILALVVGLGYAAISGYWAAGGTGLLDTVGGAFERAGHAHSSAVALLLWLVAGVKVLAAILPLLALRRITRSAWRRLVWVLAWIEAAVLTLYGFVLTATGLLIRVDVVSVSPRADHRALAWHAYLWDPWFLVWGGLVVVALLCGWPRHGPPTPWEAPPELSAPNHSRLGRLDPKPSVDRMLT